MPGTFAKSLGYVRKRAQKKVQARARQCKYEILKIVASSVIDTAWGHMMVINVSMFIVSNHG